MEKKTEWLKNHPNLLTANDVSKLLGCHGQTVYRLAATGALDSIKIGHWRRFKPSALAAFVEKRGGDSDAE